MGSVLCREMGMRGLGGCRALGGHGVLGECEVLEIWGVLVGCEVLGVWGIFGVHGIPGECEDLGFCGILGRHGVPGSRVMLLRHSTLGGHRVLGGLGSPGGFRVSPGCRGGVAALPRVTLSLAPAGGAGAAGAAAVPPGHGHVPVRHRAVWHRAQRLLPRLPRRQRRGEHGDLPEPPVHRDLRAQPQRLPSASVLRGSGRCHPRPVPNVSQPHFLAVASQCRVPLLARCAVNSVQWYWFLSYLSQGF